MREDKFSDRHIGPRSNEIDEMLKVVGADSLEDLINRTIPASILAPEKIEFPTLLDAPAPRLLAYPRDTMIAEKLEAMVVLGMANSRMKDFYDLYVLAREFAFDGSTVAGAIRATFKRRKTEIPPEPPQALTEQFAQDDTKSIQWKAFIRKSALEQDVPGFPDVLAHLREFLLPPLKAASGQALFPKEWNAGGPWVSAKPETGDI